MIFLVLYQLSYLPILNLIKTFKSKPFLLSNVGGLLKIAVNVLKVQSGARTRVYGVADRRPTTWLSALIYQESPLVNLQKRPDS